MGGGAFISMIRVGIFFVLIWSASKISRLAGVSSIVLEITTGLILSPSFLGLMPKQYAECVFKQHHDCADVHTINHIQDHLQQCDYEAYMKRDGVFLLPTDTVDASMVGSHGSTSGSDSSSGHSSTNGDNEGEMSGGDDSTPTDGHSSTSGSGDDSGGDHSSASGESGDHSTPTDGHSSTSGSGDDSSSDHNSTGDDSGDHSSGSHSSTAGHSSADGHSGGHVRRLDPFAKTRKLTMVPNSPLARTSRRLSGDQKGVTKYTDYDECLEKACALDVSHECQLTPDIFTFVGHTGVALMIFESGMHFDFEKAKEVGGWACVVAVLGTILPLITGTAVILLLIPGAGFTTDGLSAGTALAPTSVGIALKLLNEARQLQKEHGQIIITAAFVDDILSLVLFNVLFSMADGELGFMTFLPAIIGLILMSVCIVYAATLADVHIKLLMDMMPKDPAKKKISYKDEFLFFFMMMMVLVFGTVFFYTGTHLWGCFMAGMALAKLHEAHHVWVKQTKRMTVWMIRIFFSCTVAFAIPVNALLSIGAIWKGAIMGIGPCILTKVFCAFFMGDMRWVIGWAMVGRAEFAYLIAQMAAASNMMTEDVFAVVIWSLLWATIFAPFLFRIFLNRFVEYKKEQMKALHGEDYHDEDEDDAGHGGDEFRQSGHLPTVSDMHPDFLPKKEYDGKASGYTFIAKGPQGTGFYKDFIPCEKCEKECYTWEEGGLGQGLYIGHHMKQDDEGRFKVYEKASAVQEVSYHEEKHSNEKAEKPVTAHIEEAIPHKQHVEKNDVHASLHGKEEEGSEAADRGSGFLCCLFFRKIVIM